MKKILLASILLLGVVYYAVISSFTAVGVFGADGLIFSDNEIQENISDENYKEVEPREVKASDVIYARMSSFYAGEEQKSLINTDYPMYTNGGAAVQFLSSDAVLVNSDFHLSASYNGQVINNLDSFNVDGTRSDWEEYIFSKLNNGLFVNLGSMEIENTWGKNYTLPVNSMMTLSYNDGVKFYSYADGSMEGHAIADIDPSSIIRIGSVEISYEDLLIKLKLMNDESEQASGGWLDEEEEEAAAESGNKDDKNSFTKGQTEGVSGSMQGDKSGGYSMTADGNGSKDENSSDSDSDKGSGRDGGGSGDASGKSDSGKSAGGKKTGKSGGKNGQGASASSPAGSSASQTGSNSNTGSSSSGSGSSGASSAGGQSQEYTEPKVTAGTDYQIGAHYLKTSVSIEDLSGLITTSGVVYELTSASGQVTTTRIRPNGEATQTVFIPALTPNTKYNLRVYYSFNKKDGDSSVLTTVMVVSSYDFTTQATWQQGTIKLNDMGLKDALIRSNQIQIPTLSISKDSGMEEMAMTDSVVISFTSVSDAPEVKNVKVPANQLSKLLNYQSVTVYSGKNLEKNKEYSITVKFYDKDGNEISVANNTGTSRTCKTTPSASLKVLENNAEHVVISWEIGSDADAASLKNPVLKIRTPDSSFIVFDAVTGSDSIALSDISVTSGDDGITRGSVSIPASLFKGGLKYTARVYAMVDAGDGKGEQECTCGGVTFTKKGAYTVTPNNIYDITSSTISTGVTVNDPEKNIDSIVYAIYDAENGETLIKNYEFAFEKDTLSIQTVIISGLEPDHKYKLKAMYGYSTKDDSGKIIDGTSGITTFIGGYSFTTEKEAVSGMIKLEDMKLSTAKYYSDHIKIPNLQISPDSDTALVDSIAYARVIFTNKADQSTSVALLSPNNADYKDLFAELLGYYSVALESPYDLKANSVYDINVVFYDAADNEIKVSGGTGELRTCYAIPEVSLSLSVDKNNKLCATWQFTEPQIGTYTLDNYRLTIKDQTGTVFEFDGKSYMDITSLQRKNSKGITVSNNENSTSINPEPIVLVDYVEGNTYTVNMQAYGDIGDGNGYTQQKLAQTFYPLGEYAAEEAEAAQKSSKKAEKSKHTSDDALIETPNYQEPVVTASETITPGVYTLATSVTINDPASAIIGGITYEITILDDYGEGSLYKKYSVQSDGTGKSQIVLIPGLKPESHYQVTGTYRYRDKYGRPQEETVRFLEPTTFETLEVRALGAIYLDDMLLGDALLRSNTISIPQLLFTQASDNDAVGSLSRVTIKFSDGKNDFETTLTVSQLEKLSSYQAISASSPRTLKSATEYAIDVYCYDSFYNLLDTQGSHAVSRTCYESPNAVITATPNKDGSVHFSWSITNPDNVECDTYQIRIRNSTGNFVKLGANTGVSIDSYLVQGTDAITGEIDLDAFGTGTSFTAFIYAECDISDGQGKISRSIGSKQFTTTTINDLGPLYLTGSNITDATIKSDLAKLTDPDEIEAKKKEYSTRAVLQFKMNDTITEPELLQYIDAITLKLTTQGDSLEISLTDAEIHSLLYEGDTITVDTNEYTYDSGLGIISGLQSNSSYSIVFNAYKYFESTNESGETITEKVKIQVSSTLSKFRTSIMPVEILIDQTSEAVYQGFICMDIKIKDVDGVIGGDSAILRIINDTDGSLLGAFNIEKNKEQPFKLRLSADKNTSNNGLSYDILANTTYLFRFIAGEAYPETGYTTSYLLKEISRNTGESLTGKIYSLGLTDDASTSSNYTAKIALNLNVPTSKSFSQSLKQGNVYVDKVRIKNGTTTVETLPPISYDENGIAGSDYWVCEDSELAGYNVDSNGNYVTATSSSGSDCTLKFTESEFSSEKNKTNSHIKSFAEAEGITEYNLPAGYTQVEYVESNATQYITLPFGFNKDAEVEVKGTILDKGDDKFLITTQSWNTNSNRFSMLGSYSKNLTTGYGEIATQYGYYSPTININSIGDNPVVETYKNYVFECNGATRDVSSVFFGGETTNIVLFYGWNAPTRGRICYFTYKDSKNEINLIAVHRDSDNSYGLYDTITGQYYTGTKSSSFTGGSPISDLYYYVEDAYYQLSKNNSVGVPNEYVELEYIQTDGNEYINIGSKNLIGTNNFKIESEVNYPDKTSSSFRALIGNKGAGAAEAGFAIYFQNPSTSHIMWSMATGSTARETNLKIPSWNDGNFHTIAMVRDLSDPKPAYLVFDGTRYNCSYTASQISFSADTSSDIYLFTNATKSSSMSAKCQCKYIKIYVNDDLVFDFVPVMRISDNQIGMYDKKGNRFYTNSGSGSFKSSPISLLPSEFSQNQSKLPSGYIATDYIQSSGTQYIDTEVIPNDGIIQYNVKFNTRKDSAYNMTIFGSSTSNSVWTPAMWYSNTSTLSMYLSNRGGYHSTNIANYQDHELNLTVNNKGKTYEYTIDDNTFTGTFSSTLSPTTTSIFAHHNNTTYYQLYTGRIYYFQILKNGNLIRNMIPCINPSGEVGLYDTVEGKFYGNKGTGVFTTSLSYSHKLVKAHIPYTITTEVEKDENILNSYRFDYYYKYAEGTSYETRVSLGSISFTTEAEIYTIKNGYEFATKGQRNHKYVVVDDISYDCSGQSTYTYPKGSNLKAQIDFQGFSFDYTSNYYPIFYYSDKSAEISNLYLKVHVPLNRVVNNNSYHWQCCGAIVNYFYGKAQNLYIEYDQEAFPYEYDVTSSTGYWSDYDSDTLDAMDPDDAARYKYAFPTNAAGFCGNLYGSIDGFVVDLKTPMRAATWVAPLCYCTCAGASVKNGYVFCSTRDDFTAEVISYYNRNNSGSSQYAIGGVTGYVGSKANLSNVFSLVNMAYKADFYAQVGGLTGWEMEAGAKVSNAYMVGSTYNYTSGTPKDLKYGPAIGSAVSTAKSENVYYISGSDFNYKSTLNTELSYQALYSCEWQEHILNSSGNGFVVTALVDTECYPQVNWTSNCMPSQKMIPLPSFKSTSGGSDFDLAYSYTYTGDPSKVDPYSKTKTVGNTAWDDTDYNLPDFVPLEYIESDGNEYIDTGYIPSGENIEIETKLTAFDIDGGLFGVQNTGSGSQSLSGAIEGKNLYVGAGASAKLLSLSLNVDEPHNINLKTSSQKLSFILDSKAVYDDYSGLLNKTDSIYIFALNSGAGAVNYASMRLYYFHIYEAGSLVKEFIPVRRISDGAVGLYEKVEGKFYPVSGSGTFAEGPDNTYYDSGDQILCIMLSDEDETRTVYSIDIDSFELTHDDILYQTKDGSGINTIYVRMHNPCRAYSSYIINSITYEDNSTLYTSTFKYERSVNVEFFKEIYTATGEMGDNSWDFMRARYNGKDFKENLILMDDIDFSGKPFNQAFINSTFVAKLDGNGKTIKNVDYDPNVAGTLGLTSPQSPIGLIKAVSGQVKNLTLDNIHIEAGWDVGGLTADLSGGTADHVYILNSYISGGRLLGGLAGYINGSEISNCSVVNSKIVHNSGGFYSTLKSGSSYYASYYTGGLVGMMYSGSDITNSFVSDTYIETIYSTTVGVTGGLVGYCMSTSNSITSCYVTGYIVSAADRTGGLIGIIADVIAACAHNYTDVDIYSYNGWASGLVGTNKSGSNTMEVGFAFGNISSAVVYDRAGDERISIKPFYGTSGNVSGSVNGSLYSSARNYMITLNDIGGSVISNVASTNSRFTSNASLFSYSDCLEASVLSDLLGHDFTDETLLSQGRLPKLKDVSGNVLPYQSGFIGSYKNADTNAGILIDESSLSLTDEGGSYRLNLTVAHGDDVMLTKLYTDFTFVRKLCGMNDSEGNEIAEDFNSLTRRPNFVGGSESVIRSIAGQTSFEISGMRLNTMMDSYYITAIEYVDLTTNETHYMRVGLPLQIDQQWRTIGDYNDYKNYVWGSHLENFSISNSINFKKNSYPYGDNTVNNAINRMVGSSPAAGDFATAYENDNNIYPVLSGIMVNEGANDLRESGCWVNTCSRGFIGCVVSEFGKLTIKDSSVSGSGVGMGFIGETQGRIHHINIDTVSTTSTASSYTRSGFIGILKDGIDNVYAIDVYADAPNGGMIGGVIGCINLRSHNSTYKNILLKSSTLEAAWITDSSKPHTYVKASGTYLGGMIGSVSGFDDVMAHTNENSFANLIATDICVEVANGSVGGLIGNADYGNIGVESVPGSISIKDSVIKSTGTGDSNVGGVIGYSLYPIITSAKATNIDVSSASKCGGIVGYAYSVYSTVKNSSLISSRITGTGSGATGGIIGYGFGNVVITGNSTSDSTVSGSGPVGGTIGYSYYGGNTITSNTVTKSTVSGNGNYAGGIIGQAYGASGIANFTGNTVYKTNISGVSYIGGIAGYGPAMSASNIVEDCVVAGTSYVGGLNGNVTRNAPAAPSTSYITTANGYSGLVTGSRIYGSKYVGGAVGMVNQAYSSGNNIVEGSNIYGRYGLGGVTGWGSNGDISNAPGTTFSSYVEGCLITELDANAASDAYANTGRKIPVTQDLMYCGGIVGGGGGSRDSMIYNSIVGSKNFNFVGGIQGVLSGAYNSGTADDSISNISKDCIVRGNDYVGGLYGGLVPKFTAASTTVNISMGSEARMQVKNCYSNSKIVGDNFVAGIVGFYSSGTGNYEYYTSKKLTYGPIANQSAFTAHVQDCYFTGSISAVSDLATEGIAAGFVARADVSAPYAGVDTAYLPSEGRIGYYKMSLEGVASMPEYISGNVAFPVISNDSTENYSLTNMVEEAQYQLLSMWTGTKFVRKASGTERYATSLLSNASSDIDFFGGATYSGFIDTYDELSTRLSTDDEFILLMASDSTEVATLSSEKITSSIEPNIYAQALRGSSFYFNTMQGSEPEFVTGYRQLNYLESTGTQYIDTGVALNQDYSAEVKGKVANTASIIFGSRAAYANRAYNFTFNGSGSVYSWGYGSTANEISGANLNVHTMKRQKTQYYLDGVLIGTNNATTFTTPGSAYLFNCNQNDSPYNSSVPCTIYYCKIWDEQGKLIRDYVPAVRISDNALGMYDKCGSKSGDNGTSFYLSPNGNSFVSSTGFGKLDFETRKYMPFAYTSGGSVFAARNSTTITKPSGASYTVTPTQGVPLPGTGNATGNHYSDLELEDIYDDFFDDGKLPETIGHVGIETELAKHITVNPIGINKLQLAFDYSGELSAKGGDVANNDFFSGKYKTETYEIQSASFSTNVESVGISSIVTQTMDETDIVSTLNTATPKASPTYEFTYNFVDKLQIVLKYKLKTGETGAFGVYVDPENGSNVKLQTRKSSVIYDSTTYVISDGKIYQSDKSGPLISSQIGSILPAGYTAIDYLENDKIAYIAIPTSKLNTANGDYDVEVKFALSSYTTTEQFGCIYGARYNLQLSAYSSGLAYTGTGSTSSFLFSLNDIHTINGTFSTDSNRSSFYVDGIDTGLHRASGAGCQNYIFSSEGKNFSQKGRLYSFVASRNSVILMKLIPCVSADGVYGLYDLIDGHFYGNSSTDKLIGGSPSSTSYIHLYKEKVAGKDVAYALGANGNYVALSGLVEQYNQVNSSGSVANAIRNTISVSSTGIDQITVNFNKTNLSKIVNNISYTVNKTTNGYSLLSSDTIETKTSLDLNDPKVVLKYNFTDTYSMTLFYELKDGTKDSIAIDLTGNGCIDDGTYYISGGELYAKADNSKILTKSTLLPSTYTQLTYIENPSTAYIAVPTSKLNTKDGDYNVHTEFMPTALPTDAFGCIYGARYHLQLSMYSGTLAAYTGTGSTSTETFSLNSRYVVDGTFSTDVNRSMFKINGKDTKIYRASGTGCQNYIFSSEGATFAQKGRLYSFVAERNSTVLMNLIPCKNASNVVGLYDLVGKDFYPSSSSVKFTAGAECSSEINLVHIYGDKALNSMGQIVTITTP